MIPVFDSNIVIDFLKGHAQAASELGKYDTRYMSVVSWIEAMTGERDTASRHRTKIWLAEVFRILPISDPIAEVAAELRRTRRLKLPDAVIWATAKANNTLLITRNTKDFPTDEPDIRIPYALA